MSSEGFEDLPRVRELALFFPTKRDREALNEIADRWHAYAARWDNQRKKIEQKLHAIEAMETVHGGTGIIRSESCEIARQALKISTLPVNRED